MGFRGGDLSATVGKPLQYLDPSYDGRFRFHRRDKTAPLVRRPISAFRTLAASRTASCRVPGTLSRQIGYVLDHGIKPNGGGTRVNQYTLIMDVSRPRARGCIPADEFREQHGRR